MAKLFCAHCGLGVRWRDFSCFYCHGLVPTWQHVALVIVPTSIVGVILLQLFY